MKYTDALDEKEIDIDGTLEFSLDDKQIQEFIGKLLELRDSEEHVHFDVDPVTSMIIHHKKDPLLKFRGKK